ncbi:GAF domain-containing protein [Deinococcus ruber]|nr:GAF domain-containing protein [Deinococcus ruber]
MFTAPLSGPDLSERLQEVTEALALSSTAERIFEVVLPAVSSAVQASACMLLTPGPEDDEPSGSHELSDRRGVDFAGIAGPLTWQPVYAQTDMLAQQSTRAGRPLALETATRTADLLPLDAQRTQPVRVTCAAFPLLLDERALGVLAVEFVQPFELSVAQQRFLRVVAAQAAIALGRAQGLGQLEHRVQARTRELNEQRAALNAFVTFAEAAGTVTDELTLARQALETVEVLFPGCNTSYYLPEEGRWKAKLYAGTLTPEMAAFITAGLPPESPLLAPALHSREVYFADAVQIELDHLQTRGQYGALGVYPLVVGGRVEALLGIGLLDISVWSDLNRALFRSIGRSLNLAVERARQASVLQAHRAELEAQTRVLEAFSAFSHDLALLQEPFAVIRRAQELILAQLPQGYSVYYELEGGLWRSRSQAGELTEGLQRVVDAGRAYHDSWSNVQAWESGEPVYQDLYDPATDTVGALASHVRATATLPVRVGGQARGLLRVALTSSSPDVPGGWTRTERVMLETLVRHLGTVLAGADQAAALERQREATLAQTRVLEAFAVFAHDVTQLSGQEAVIRRAQEIVLSMLPGSHSIYFERGPDAWVPRSWVGDVPADTLASIRAGRAFGESVYLERPWATSLAYYHANDDPAADPDVLGSAGQATASFPVEVAGQPTPVGVMCLALGDERQSWTNTDRTVIETMIRTLGLVLDGVRSAELLTRQNALLETQNTQLEAQTRSLRGFNELTRQLSGHTDPHALVQRALEGMLSLLPNGYVVYFELEQTAARGGLWLQKAIAGQYARPDLEAVVRAGLPYATTRNLTQPWETRQPFYQNSYAPGTDELNLELVNLRSATACLPVLVNNRPYGVIACVLVAVRDWSETDRDVLESIVRSLGLAIEGAQGVEALRAKTVELERSNAELERFAYIASHDLQEPLRTISSFSDLLQRRYRDQLDPKAQQYLDFIYKGSGQMKALVDDLLTFSRLSAERTQKRSMSLAEPVQEAIERLSAAILESGAIIQADALPVVLGDGPQLAQLFQNLIGNAIKFRRRGVAPRIEVRAVRTDEHWHVSVHDNGIGMKPEYFERIFVMFQRLHHRSEYQGTGLGLSICQKIVEQHGGRVWVESVEGEGSTFHFTLRAGTDAEGEARPVSVG